MAHPHHLHREHQVSHRRVHHILKGEPAGAKEHSKRHAFSKVTSKTGAEHHDAFVAGMSSPKRYARGGKVKGKKGHQTNIAIVMPHHPPAAPAGPIPGPGAPPPGGAPPMMAKPPMAGPPGAPPGMPPGMPPPPMRKHGGRVKKAGGGAADDEVVRRVESAAASALNRGAMNRYGERGDKPDSRSPTGPMTRDRSRGGRAKAGGGAMDGESTKGNIKKWGKEASDNSYAKGGFVKPKVIDRGGAASGVGREEKAEHMRHRK
jgi:hypothetical protein